MKTTTESPPPYFPLAKSFLYATLLTITSLFLLCFALYPHPRVPTFHNIPTTTSIQLTPSTPPITTSTIQHQHTNISHLLFAIAGSAATWEERSTYASLWWRPGLTRGHVWLDSKPQRSLHSLLLSVSTSTTPPYKISDPKWKTFPFSSSQSAVRIARILLESFQLGLKDVRWFVLGDDDTVFFPDNLATVLGRYDYNEMYYVGGNSESVEQNEMHSYDMAFGGGGFAISYRLAEELVEILDSCLERFYDLYGSDQRIWACVAELGVSLTREPGFHQLDVRGSAYGLLAAHPVAPLVSLHHLDAVELMFPKSKSRIDSVGLLLQAYTKDHTRILQRSLCYDNARNWTLSVSWGYSVEVWPKTVHVHEMLMAIQTFKTWRWDDKPFTFDTKGVSPTPCNQPIVYYMDHIKGNEAESVSLYKMEKRMPGVIWGSGCEKPEYLLAANISKIVVAAAKMDPADWQKVPRRQCCEIVEAGDRKHTMKLQLRKCQRGETISNNFAAPR